MLFASARTIQIQQKVIHHGKVLLPWQITRNKSSRNVNENEYQFIDRSRFPTMYFQDSLPHLPVPDLRGSCSKYMRAQKPLLTDSELEATRKYVEEFCNNEGSILQKELIRLDRSDLKGNYVSPFWFKMYLSDRKPLPINYNPMIVIDQEKDPMYNTQLVKATNIVISTLRFVRSLRENVLAPEIFFMKPKTAESTLFHIACKITPRRFKAYAAMSMKAFPLDMSQYHNLFCTTRLPRQDIDEIYEDPSARHIVVTRRGHFYGINVLDENGYIIDSKDIAASLKAILDDNLPPNEVPIGVLTTSERNKWAKTRSHLTELGNSNVLNCIDSAIFVLNLDDDVMDESPTKLIHNYLHADGTNRWFDKSLSLIVTKDGYAGINFEHSWGDGVAVLRLAKDLKADISKNPQFHPSDIDYISEKATSLTRLEFIVDDQIKGIVATEKKKYAEWCERLSIGSIIYTGFGKDQCKKFKVSPDAIMQLAFQLAMYNLSGRFVPTYESCSTAVFKLGRTETIRPCTMETKAACLAMSRETNSVADLKKLLTDCSNTHLKLTKEAAMGQGFDRHLFVLKQLAAEGNMATPAIYTDPAYEEINRNVLSTSTLSHPAIIAGGFGPTINNGFGIGYMIQDAKLGAVVTSYKDSYDAGDYVQSFEEALKRIHKVLLHE